MGVIRIVIFLALAFFLASGVFTNYAGHLDWESQSAGFFSGIIHGVIAPAMVIVSLFTPYTVYEINNIGWWYNFGFVIGILITWAGGKSVNNITKNYYSSGEAKLKSWFRRDKKEDKHEDKDIDKIVEDKVKSVLSKEKSKDKEKDDDEEEIEEPEELKEEKDDKKQKARKKKK